MDLTLDKVEDAVAAVARGELVVVVDDTDRENEGDLIMAAQKASSEAMAFMIRHTSGIICAPLTAERAAELALPPMVANNLDPMRTAFTVSVDVREGMTTGISAAERCNTVRALASHNAGARDFLRPGHVFPLIAREGGVLTRSGHTEAATDLCTLAGLEPVGVLAEVVNDDGTVKRLPELVPFAHEHGLRIISIEDLIAYRVTRETFVRKVREEAMAVAGLAGTVAVFATPFDDVQHVVAVFGAVRGADRVPVRIHREQPVTDQFGRAAGRRSWVEGAVEVVRREGNGVLMLLRTAALDDFASDAAGEGDEHHGSALARRQRWREVGVGAQILRELGVRSIREIAATERGYVGLSGFGIDICGTIRVES